MTPDSHDSSPGRDPLSRLSHRLENLPADETASDPLEATTEPSDAAPPLSIPPADALLSLSDFRIQGELGRGAMGVVYRAHQVSLDRQVALKVLPPLYCDDPRRLARFLAESRKASRVSHPNIVEVYSVGEEHGVHYIAQQLVENGRTLSHWLGERRALSDPAEYYAEVARVFSKISSALAAAHVQGIVHRDVKPSNILITPKGEPKVADFGLAKDLQGVGITGSGECLGTPSFMSPEQIDSKKGPVGPQSDVFSLGSTLYEVITFHRLFDGDSREEILQKVLQLNAPDPRKMRSKIPADLSTICLKALEKERRRRYPSMDQMEEDLSSFLEGKPIFARPPSQLYLAARYVRRHPTRSAVAMVVSLAMVVIVSLFLYVKRQSYLLLRSTDLQEIKDLQNAADTLWPAHPNFLIQYESWVTHGKKLLGNLPIHQRQLDEIRLNHDLKSRWWSSLLVELIDGLAAMQSQLLSTAPGSTSPVHGWSIPHRIDFANRLCDGFATGGAYASLWSKHLSAIRSAYQIPDLSPQMGLVPLGLDQASGLWEFVHLQTGNIPERSADGTLAITEETGLVLVLIPGGSFSMGNPTGGNKDELPAREIKIDPFFLSKHEMTQAQWIRCVGENPSDYHPDPDTPYGVTLLHPVEQVSWSRCNQVCLWLGLSLPTEAQWEYAARAGTASQWPWWTGPTSDSLLGAANISDQAAKLAGAPFDSFENWSDGYPVSAPVDSLRPNPFGLHHILGNVWEWCLDEFGSYGVEPRPGDGLRRPMTGKDRIYRGGGFDHPLDHARCAYRGYFMPDTQDGVLGLRPSGPVLRDVAEPTNRR